MSLCNAKWLSDSVTFYYCHHPFFTTFIAFFIMSRLTLFVFHKLMPVVVFFAPLFAYYHVDTSPHDALLGLQSEVWSITHDRRARVSIPPQTNNVPQTVFISLLLFFLKRLLEFCRKHHRLVNSECGRKRRGCGHSPHKSTLDCATHHSVGPATLLLVAPVFRIGNAWSRKCQTHGRIVGSSHTTIVIT